MGISELRQLDAQALYNVGPLQDLGADLVQVGTISRADAKLAQLVQQYCDAPLARVLQAEGLASEAEILAAQACRANTIVLASDQLQDAGTPSTDIDARIFLRHGSAQIIDMEGKPHLALSDPTALSALIEDLPASKQADIGTLPIVIAPRRDIQDMTANENRAALTRVAQSRVPLIESCRNWSAAPYRRLAATLAVIGMCIALSFAFPTLLFSVFIGWAAFTLLVSAALKTAAFCARIMAGNPETQPPPVSSGQKLPKVSVLVPLFRETEIAHALIKRLSRLTYPKCLLDVVLVLEENDALTRQTLAEIDLPPWMRAVVVPDGQPRTKPRAMNYALDFCEGDIIGIFDAEDAPDPDQITTIARRFQTAPPDLVCLQGILDYYNPRQNWLARCFTIEYATWFRTMLPGLARLGFAIPLGGTTLYFRRDVLEELGGWDAHNVTEDADLGFRLARHGYRTEVIGTVTGEEANCRAWPWIKQRSRWLKGYMTTYLVHMRRPRLLYRQLGAWKFWGFQAHFITALSQFMLAPFLWSFWLVLLGLPHPLDPVLSREVLMRVGQLFLAVEVLNVAIHTFSVSGRAHRHLMRWTPSMPFYAPLGTIAAYKALYEMVFAPFFWDKTRHGHSLALVNAPASDGGVDLTGIQLQPGHERF